MRATLPALALLLIAAAPVPAHDMATVGPAQFRPLYPPAKGRETVDVPAFRLDRVAVTNAEFLAFVRAHPEWRRGRVAALFADDGYLSGWSGPLRLGSGVDPRAPVVSVSWFAAKAYCEARGGRLPTELEWELAAAASETTADARLQPEWQQQVLSWYARPNETRLRPVGQGRPNLWGIRDLHGLIWEWVLDFNATLLSDGKEGSPLRFCGEGALSAREREDYASFMRVALRSALDARDTTRNLGFRCAADLENRP